MEIVELNAIEAMSEIEDGSKPIVRKIRIHKIRPSSAPLDDKSENDRNVELDRRIAELIPGIADLSVSSSALSSKASATASEVRQQKLSRDEAHRAELNELNTIFDMSQPNAVDKQMPEGPWTQELRPKVRKVQLSPYQYEMINYQRMLMRKNIWYYRDRLNVPRGPCPLHVLKDAWVQVRVRMGLHGMWV